MSDLNTIDEAFEAMAAAFKRQFRLELIMESLSEGNVVHVTDEQSAGDVKYLGTLRSNWLRRQAPKYGFLSIGQELLPEVAGGAYRYVGVKGESETIEEAEVLAGQFLENAKIHDISVVPDHEALIGHAIAAVGETLEADDQFVVVHDDPPVDADVPSYREQFLDKEE